MSRSFGRGTIAAIGAVLAVTLVGVALASPFAGTADAAGPRGPAFRIRGHVAALYPGATTRMTVRVRNLEAFRIVVRTVTATVERPSPGCPAGAVKVKPWKSRVKVAPGGVVRLRMRVRMRRDAPNACLGARWPIAFAGAGFRP